MPALVDVFPTKIARLSPRTGDRPVCKICSDSMVAAEASAFLTEDTISYLWTCDNCGYGFVTKHTTRAIVRN